MRTFTIILLTFFVLSFFSGCAATAPPPAPEPIEPPAPLDYGKELGQRFLKTALKEYTFVRDPEVVQVVNQVGREIVQAIGEDPSTYHFLVVRQNQLNAFAIPGGYIFIFDGLMKRFDSLEALAGVLAHEIAHVRLNHFFKDAKKINAINLATMASIILAGLAGEGQGATGTIAIAANVSLQLQFSRKNEEEADLHAVRFLNQTDYHPDGLSTFFKTLSFYQQFTQGDAPSYLSTHPGVDERRFMVEDLVANLPLKEKPPHLPTVDWGRIAVILRAGDGRRGQSPLADPGNGEQPLDVERRLYLTGFSALKSGELQTALRSYQEVIRINPTKAIYYADLSQIFMGLQQAPQAKEAALKSISLAEDNADPYLVLGMIAQSEEDHQRAVAHLEKARIRAPGNPMIHFQLARSYHALSQSAVERYHLGKYHRLNLSPEQAVVEFRKALKFTDTESVLGQKTLREIEEIAQEGL